MTKALLFYLFSGVMLFAALRVVTARNPVHAVLYLILHAVDVSKFRAGKISSVDNPKILLDAVVMTLNIAGQVLLSFAFMEQWYLWILVNISSISLWAVALASGTGSGNAAVMLIKYIFYLMNSLNGLRIWLNLSRRRISNDLEN